MVTVVSVTQGGLRCVTTLTPWSGLSPTKKTFIAMPNYLAAP